MKNNTQITAYHAIFNKKLASVRCPEENVDSRKEELRTLLLAECADQLIQINDDNEINKDGFYLKVSPVHTEEMDRKPLPKVKFNQ